MSRLILIFLIFSENEINYKKEFLKMGIQFSSGVLMGISSTYLLFKIFPPEYLQGDIVRTDFEVAILNITTGLTFGSYLGVVIAGKIMKRKGGMEKTFLGSFLGFLSGAAIFAFLSEELKDTRYENLSFIPLFILPSLGGTLGYNFDFLFLKNKASKSSITPPGCKE